MLHPSLLLFFCFLVGGCQNTVATLFNETTPTEADNRKDVIPVNPRGLRRLPAGFGSAGLCVVGCTPYVDPTNPDAGIRKYRALIEEMAQNCDVLVHVGDTKPGRMPCNDAVLTDAVHSLSDAAAAHQKLALYAPGGNELNDCHRLWSENIAADRYKASDARQFLIDDLALTRNRDLTGRYRIVSHKALDSTIIPGTSGLTHRCEFDKYVEVNNYAMATLEVTGSLWYLKDETPEIDPLEDRYPMYLNAQSCALDWIHRSANRAARNGKRALFFMLHASFYRNNGSEAMPDGRVIDGNMVRPYEPLFEKLTETALAHKDIMFYVVHADAHRFSQMRMNPSLDNGDLKNKLRSHHNLMIVQVEGASRALTMYSKFTVDSSTFQPVTLKQEWSQAAYDEVPVGHSWIAYN